MLRILYAINIVETNKGRIRKVNFDSTMPNNLDDINTVTEIASNTKYRDNFKFEHTNLTGTSAFRVMADAKWK